MGVYTKLNKEEYKELEKKFILHCEADPKSTDYSLYVDNKKKLTFGIGFNIEDNPNWLAIALLHKFSSLKPIEEIKMVTCHIGQGASICAIDGGKSIETSMGLSPLSGIAMVTRSGDLDPAVVTEIMDRENLTTKEVTTVLNKKSGLYGITGLNPDFREIELASYEDDKPKAKVAIELFTKIIAQFVAKYAVSLKGIDAVVFTGGIGENQINIRKKICENLEWMGLKLDLERNNVRSEEKKISTDDSKIAAFVIPTDEEMVIARDTKRIVEGK